MNTASNLQAVKQLQALLSRLRGELEQGDWQNAVVLLPDLRRLAELLDLGTASDREWLAEAQALLAQLQALEHHCRVERDELANKILAAQSSRRGASAYRSVH